MSRDSVSARAVPEKSARRISAAVALTLLEVIKQQDIPTEVLESEDPTVTMPRRLGLSDVVEMQIRRYREEARRKGRITDEEFRDLVRLVIRRPDSEEVFFHAGTFLAGDDSGGWRRGLPRSLAFGLARREAKRGLTKLFGRRLGGFGAGPFQLEGRAHLLVVSDPGGDCCQFLTGYCQAVVQRYCGRRARVAHTLCEGRRDALCRWTVVAEERKPEEARALILNPEAG